MKATGCLWFGLLAAIAISCSERTNNQVKRIKKGASGEQPAPQYNELANPDNRSSFTTSDYNADNPIKRNRARPQTKIDTRLDTAALFAIWTSDPNGPHADFVFSSKSFFVVDYDGDGDMPYVLQNNTLTIFYNDFIQDGSIVSVNEDTLKIKWKGFKHVNSYVKWNN